MIKQFKQIKNEVSGLKVIRTIDLESGEKLLSLFKEFDIKSFAEIGVLCGDMTKYLSDNHDFDKYYAIDSWLRTNQGLSRFTQEEIDIAYKFCLDRFKDVDNIKVMKKKSVEASKLFVDDSIDCVFIDAGHESKSVTEDIGAWFPKVKKLLIGHDYVVFAPVKNVVDFLLPQREIYKNLWYVTK